MFFARDVGLTLAKSIIKSSDTPETQFYQENYNHFNAQSSEQNINTDYFATHIYTSTTSGNSITTMKTQLKIIPSHHQPSTIL